VICKMAILIVALAALLPVAAQTETLPSEQSGGSASNAQPDRPCHPTYPAAAVKARAEGVTMMKLTIDAHGQISKAEVVDSAGSTPEHKLLDQAVVRVMKGCLWSKPKIDANGEAIEYSVTMGYHWGLPPADGSPSKAHPARLGTVEPRCRPVYPPVALRAGAQGVTVLRMVVDSSGHVRSTEVLQSAGETAEHKLLDEAAAAALPLCPYVPGTGTDGMPIGSSLTVSYVWKLE